jgi:hypothetical protein
MCNERTLILLIALAAAGCAELSEQSSDARSERVYRTGSNVPVHERTSGNVLTLDRDAGEDLIRRNQALPTPSPVKSN